MAYGSGRIFRRRKGGSWYIAYMLHGAEVKESTKSKDRRVAEELLEARRKAVRAGQVVDRSGEKQTVGDLLDALDKYHEAKDRQRVPYVIAALKDAFGWVKAMELTTDDVRRAVLDWKAAGKAAATINRRLAALSKAYTLSLLPIDKRRLHVRGEMLREDNVRTARLPASKKRAYIAALPAYLRDFWTVADLTGKRRGQLAWTTWDDYDAATNTLYWRSSDTKSRAAEALPLAGKVSAIIKRLYRTRPEHCSFIFHGESCAPGRKPSRRYACIGDGKKAFSTAAQAIGMGGGRKLGGVTFHSTRVNFVSEATERGVPAHVVMAITGHRTRSVFDRYHLAPTGQIRDALR